MRQNKVCNGSMEERGEKAKAGNIANILENCMCRHHMSYVLYHDNRFPSGQERIRASRASNTILWLLIIPSWTYLVMKWD